MSSAFRCPECGSPNHIFEALNESLLAITSDLSTEAVFERIVDVARKLIHASFAALGVTAGDGGFSHFVTSVRSDAQPLDPKTERLLAALLRDTTPYATNDLTRHERFERWPEGYPDLKSFLAVPIVSGGEIVGGLFLGNENTWGFRPEDKDLVELVAPHAGLAIKNVRLYEQSRELSVVQERNRLARELHDSVTQTLFSMKLTAETLDTLLESDPAEARAQLERLRSLARDASTEMRSLVFELRPPELETDGLVATLRKHIEVLRRVHHLDIELHHRGDRVLNATQERELFRVAQEALNNAVRHAGASEIVIEVVTAPDALRLTVTDNGSGFDAEARRNGGRLGLVSMRERAQGLGGDLAITSAPGRGTVIALEVQQ